MSATLSIRQLIQLAASRLVSSDTPRLDAELLLMHVLNVDRSYLHAWPEKTLADENLALFYALLSRREQGEPMAYILGQREFFSLNFKVTPATLIPRPETELLVELVLDQFSNQEILSLLDLGTGSGAIALAIAKACSAWSIVATDQSSEALLIAKENAKQLELDNINFALGTWFDAVPDQLFNIIISNPPYIPEGDPHLEEGVLCFEPSEALMSGSDGLDDLKRIISKAPYALQPGGCLMLEFGYDQGKCVHALLEKAGYMDIHLYKDYAGHDRVVVATFP